MSEPPKRAQKQKRKFWPINSPLKKKTPSAEALHFYATMAAISSNGLEFRVQRSAPKNPNPNPNPVSRLGAVAVGCRAADGGLLGLGLAEPLVLFRILSTLPLV